MVRFLPPQPDLEHIKNEAKALHKAHQQRKPEVCEVLRHLGRFRNADNEEIFAAGVPLTEVQFALAVEYGFSSWRELRAAVLNLRPPADYAADAENGAMLLPDPPAGISGANRLAAAYSMALSYLGTSADYATVLGDSGLAFILQADALHKPYNTSINQLDIGWWPLDPWGAMLRLEFLGQAFGIPMRQLPREMLEYMAAPDLHYRKYHEAEVAASLRAGRPAVAMARDTYVVFGGDSGNPPLLGQLACTEAADIRRLENFPFEIVVFGEPGRPMDRRRADVEALGFAVRLGRDEVDLSHLPGKSSGRRSWELWLDQLGDAELCGPHFYHANVLGHLKTNRRGAAVYLREMSTRHLPPVSDSLVGAASEYDLVVAKLQQVNASEDALSTPAGRQELIAQIREVMQFETAALDQMAEAARAMR